MHELRADRLQGHIFFGGGGLAGETRARAEFTPARANLEADPDLIHNSTLKRLEIDWLVSVVSHRTRG